jgi:hypothetical protein
MPLLNSFYRLPRVRVLDNTDLAEIPIGTKGEVCFVIDNAPIPISVALDGHSYMQYAFTPDQLEIIKDDDD